MDAVLLPIRKGSKATTRKAWSEITYDMTQKESFQKSLNNAPAIGVVLHTDRTSLCSIDIDDDMLLEIFLAQNPQLENTLRTKGKKGGNLWLKLKGNYPAFKKLKHEGEPAGEWRVNKAYTIITGKHPEGMDYLVTVDKPPLEIEFSEINWQGFFPFSTACHTDTTDNIDNTDYIDHSVEKREETTTPNPPKSTTELIERIKATEESMIAGDLARSELEADEDKAIMYRKYIDRCGEAKDGQRNSMLVAMTTFLFHAVSEKLIIPLVQAFYEINQAIFPDSLETHLHEANEQLENVKETWLESLNAGEKAVYEHLEKSEKDYTDTFRICRELHRHEGGNSFYLSCDNLGKRLGVKEKSRSNTAGRKLKDFVAYGIIKVVKKGTQHSKQGKGKATVYRWLL